LIGAPRGLGLAIAEGYLAKGAHVVATVRGPSHTAQHQIQEAFASRLDIEAVDISIPEQIAGLHDRLATRRFDLLFVSAGIPNDPQETVADASTEEFSRLMVTNALSPLRAIEAFKDLVTFTGTIAIMSSGQGSIGNNTRGGFEICRASRAALNQLMRSYAARQHDDPRTLLLARVGCSIPASVGRMRRPPSETACPHCCEQSMTSTVEAACNSLTTSAGPSPGQAGHPTMPQRLHGMPRQKIVAPRHKWVDDFA